MHARARKQVTAIPIETETPITRLHTHYRGIEHV
jgi:hypothetical protein